MLISSSGWILFQEIPPSGNPEPAKDPEIGSGRGSVPENSSRLGVIVTGMALEGRPSHEISRRIPRVRVRS